jgi:CTP:molybdopterin cytidylyltransferase MocA
MGRAKALLTDREGVPLVEVAAGRLADAGCSSVTVVLGAQADEVLALLSDGPRLQVVIAEDWSEGMAASLRHGLAAVPPAEAALITLVDLPDVGAEVVRRILEVWGSDGARADALVRATYDGLPGHPVLIGRDHWAGLREELTGDSGAQRYLSSRKVVEVSCEDLATGRDVDRPEDLA